jgi:hypothetical protein
VLTSIQKQETLSEDVEAAYDQQISAGDRWADRIATFGGSWVFIGSFGAVLLVWIAINLSSLFASPFDPYPFILLNLLLSCLAAVQAPLIMMSQRRQEAKDRLRPRNDYRVNLKAELENPPAARKAGPPADQAMAAADRDPADPARYHGRHRRKRSAEGLTGRLAGRAHAPILERGQFSWKRRRIMCVAPDEAPAEIRGLIQLITVR